MPREEAQLTEAGVFLKHHQEKWKETRPIGQGSEDAIRRQVSPDSVISRGAHDCVNQFPFDSVCPM